MAVLKPEAVQFLILHCTNTTPKQNLDAKAIDRLHRGEGKLSIGYHFVIRRDGVVEEGRKLDQIGAHHRGYNDKSIGICLVGWGDDYSRPQRDSLKGLLDTLCSHFTSPNILNLTNIDLTK